MTIKTKITLITLLIFLTFIFSGCRYIKSYLEKEWQQDIATRHLSMLEKIAKDKEDDINQRLEWVENSASKIDAKTLSDVNLLKQFFENRINSSILFEDGIAIIDKMVLVYLIHLQFITELV
ncbi:MAG: hypothetical protein HXX81_04230 [Campylobacterales bacterium]|nr:hypothetical protein [Campylobacterales bacterium]